MRLRADEVEKIVYHLSYLFSYKRPEFYDVCGKLLLYCLAIGDRFMADMLWRELRRDLDHVPLHFLPLFGKFSFRGEVNCDMLFGLKDRVLCLCSKILSGKRVYFWQVLKLIYQIFRKGSIEDIVFMVRWLSLVIFKNHNVISLDEILEGRGV